jgi:hypothetical protein
MQEPQIQFDSVICGTAGSFLLYLQKYMIGTICGGNYKGLYSKNIIKLTLITL